MAHSGSRQAPVNGNLLWVGFECGNVSETWLHIPGICPYLGQQTCQVMFLCENACVLEILTADGLYLSHYRMQFQPIKIQHC